MIAAVAAACFAASSAVLLGAALSSRSGRRPPRWFAEPVRDQPATTDRPVRSARTLAAAAGGLASILGWLAVGPPGLVVGAVTGIALPLVQERRGRARRVREIQERLLDAVAAIASALRSGRSLVQALAIAAEDVGGPLGALLGDAARRVTLGVPLEEALEDIADRVGGSDARLVTGVLALHRRTGGALAASLDDLGRTLRARRDGARELRSLTAQARLSAAILGLLPLGFFLFLSVVARRDVESAYRTTAGASAIGVGLALQGAAFVWIRRLLRVEEA